MVSDLDRERIAKRERLNAWIAQITGLIGALIGLVALMKS
jgi:hypothetical protein